MDGSLSAILPKLLPPSSVVFTQSFRTIVRITGELINAIPQKGSTGLVSGRCLGMPHMKFKKRIFVNDRVKGHLRSAEVKMGQSQHNISRRAVLMDLDSIILRMSLIMLDVPIAFSEVERSFEVRV